MNPIPAGRVPALIPALILFLGLFLSLVTAVPAGAQNMDRGGETFAVPTQFLAVEETTLAAGLAAKVQKLPLREGDSFQAGATLVGMDCSGLRAARDQAAAELKAARTKVQANEELAKYNSISGVDVKLSLAARDMAQAQLKVRESALDHCVERAPFPGQVAQVYVKPHQWVEPGQPLMTILNPDELEAECIVPSKWLRWLKEGHPVDILVDETGQTVHCAVEAVFPHVDPVSQTVKVRVKVEPSPGLLPGMSGTAAFYPPQ